MPEIEYIVDKLEVKYEGITDIGDFYEFIRSFIEGLGYNVTEKEHEEAGKKKFLIKCKCEKPVDNYTNFVIKVSINSSHETVEVKKKHMQKGNFKLILKGLIERDYQERWGTENRRFFRGIYDKLIAVGKKKSHESDLKDDVYAIAEKAKRYWGMHKL